MKYSPVVPAIIPTSKAEVIEFSRQLSFSRELQLDLVDGEFVDSVCWPYSPEGEPLSVKPFLDIYTLEIDLMVKDQIKAATDWIVAGADMIVFHVEGISLQTFKSFAAGVHDVSLGVSAHGDTSMETLSEYIEHADYIQLMGIEQVGSQGLPFDEKVIDKIIYLKKRFPNKSITIDGSVNASTIQRLKEAGADRFICGSAIVQQDNPEQAHADLHKLVV